MSSLEVPDEEIRTRRRRTSSVGHINVGDTASSGFTTLHTTKQQRKRSKSRLVELESHSKSDTAIVHKIIVAFQELTYRHTWIYPLIYLGGILATFYLSTPESKTHQTLARFIIPQYHFSGTDQYGKGGDDFKFVAFYALVFTFIREFLMCCFLRPIAKFCGIKRESKQKRFMEQTYSMCYYGCTGPIGLWIMSRLPLWYFNTTQFYINYPHKTHDLYFKVYYLGQAAFWVQQSVVLVLQLEKPRKDFKELVFHHIVTIALIWCSYRFHFTWIGLAIYITMDISDFVLATSKTLNYLNSPITGPFFVVFIGVWVYLRHYLNLKILWSVLTEFRTVGEWELNWDTQQYKCYISQPITFGLIFALQLVNIYWLFLIFRILYRYIYVGVTEDERSDDEDESEVSSEEESKKKN
ncbi:Sphingosine N-acyltransferase LAG1 [Spathaspora sp. JA1]|nr:Sphingosine N-acyltransferase LAG1 [Spathaspora sp. JA1]